jgi:protein SFI1
MRADQTYSNQTVSATFGRWRASAAKIRSDREVADRARAFFVIRQVFGVWKARVEHRRQERWIDARRAELVRRVFTRESALQNVCDGDPQMLMRAEWREEMDLSIEGRRQADEFRQTSNQVFPTLLTSGRQR